MVKRTFDLLCSALALLVLSPVMLAVALLVRRSDGGPVFYRGLRAGRFGKPFRVYKFRTMALNAEQIGGPSTADEDPRITRPGKFLRKYKLDELPELINVLRGEMSIVGPRPEVPQYVALFSEEEKKILDLRPGITDWATLWNSDEGAVLSRSDDPEKAYLEKIRPTKVRLQLEYAYRHSLLVDLSIVMQTLLAIIVRRKPDALSVLDT